MFLDEVAPSELGYTAQDWIALTRHEKWIALAYFHRRTINGVEEALGYQRHGSFVSKKITELCLRERMSNVQG